MFSRREFLAMMAAGMVMTAEGIWMPGQKLISIPSKKIFMPELPPGRMELKGSGYEHIWTNPDWYESKGPLNGI